MSAPNFVAGGTIQPCRFVTLSGGDFTVVQCTAETNPIAGISQEGSHDAPGLTGSATDAARSGHQLKVYGQSDECLLELGTGGATRGNQLKSDTAGKGVAVTNTETAANTFIGADALESGSAGEKIRVRVRIQTFRPA